MEEEFTGTEEGKTGRDRAASQAAGGYLWYHRWFVSRPSGRDYVKKKNVREKLGEDYALQMRH